MGSAPDQPRPRQPTDPRQAAERIVRILQEAGFVAYFAGGCVRDMLLGLEPKDYDVATDAPPQRVGELFHRARPVGEAFGVVLVRIKGCEIEVATFRSEGAYSDGRRPDTVTFTDARHDAERRDFTINGMFFDPVTEQVHDWVGGRADLAAGRIRAIGDPEARLTEDYLRMLRAVRFAAGYDFTLEAATRAAIQRHARKLARISRERIGMEVQAMLTGPRPAKAAELLTAVGLDAPTLNEPHQDAPLPILNYLRAAPYPAMLAGWALDRHLPVVPEEATSRSTNERTGPLTDLAERVQRMKPILLANRWRKALTLSNADRNAMEHLLVGLPEVLDWAHLTVAARKRTAGGEDWPQRFELAQALAATVEADGALAPIAQQVVDMERDGIGLTPEPLISGDDLIAAGWLPGPAFRRVLDAVYDAQLEGRVTDRQAALTLAEQLKQTS